MNASDPTGLITCGGWIPIGCGVVTDAQNTVSGAPKHIRPPDYVSLSVTVGIPGTPLVATGGVIVTSQGHVYVTGGGGLGGGIDVNASASWLNQANPAPACELDLFVHGLSLTGSADVPVWPYAGIFGVGPMAGETWGQPGQINSSAGSTDLGVGVGSIGASGVATYSGRLPFNVPGW